MADEVLSQVYLVVAIATAIAAILAFCANVIMIREMQKDRKLAFAIGQVEKLYAPLLVWLSIMNDEQIEESRPIVDILGMRENLYLATPELRKTIDKTSLIEKDFINDKLAITNSGKPLSSMSEPQKERRHETIDARRQVIRQAQDDYKRLREEIETVVAR